jgi:thiamine biosynthesis lipoprotein
MNQPHSINNARNFTHDAMNTTFNLHFRGLDESTARDMARECFEQIDWLEAHLSRFIDGSDVWRINRMQSGETLFLNEACHQCLLLALEAHALTGGLFDITLGAVIQHMKTKPEEMLPALAGMLAVHPDTPAISCLEAGREIDLGGIGKGFALDQLRKLINEWGVNDALLSAGASSILAIGPHPWPVNICGSTESLRIEIRNQALSASGITIQGEHIFHPHGSNAMPKDRCTRVWIGAPDATSAEVWSTALMLVDASSIASAIESNSSLQFIHVERGGHIEKIR